MVTRVIDAALVTRGLSKSRVEAILRNASKASLRNPRNAGTLASGVTITSGAGIPAQTPVTYAFDQSNLGPFHVVGGKLLLASPFNYVAPAIQDAAGTKAYTYCRINFMAYSRYVAIRLGAQASSPYRILVNGQYLDPAAFAASGYPFAPTATTYYLMDFGTRAERRITVEGQQNNANFTTAYVEASGKIYRPDTSDHVNAVFLGDSYAQGLAADFKGDGFAVQMADRLGMQLTSSGVGGTSWDHQNRYDATTNAAGTYGFDQRIANGDLTLSYQTPNVIFLMASVNDKSRNQALVQARTLAGLQAARSQFPNAVIIVFGCAGATYLSTVLATEAAVQAAVTAFADPFTAFVPISTDPLGAVMSGDGYQLKLTGSVTAATAATLAVPWAFTTQTLNFLFDDGSLRTGTLTLNSAAITWTGGAVTAGPLVGAYTTTMGNTIWGIVQDGTHLTPEGCTYFGNRYALKVITALKNMAGV